MLTTEQLTRPLTEEQEPYPVMIGPLAESALISAGTDYYKPTMSQVAFNKEPNAEVRFTFKNRGNQRLLDYIDPDNLQARFDAIRDKGWSDMELAYLGSITNSDDEAVFSQEYLDHIKSSSMPEAVVRYDEDKDDLAIDTTGPWEMATFWETVVMSQVNEAYFENYMIKHNLNPIDVYNEGDKRLSEKIAILKDNPDIKFADFGTRRRFSLRWQMHVLERLAAECPDNFIGTSNVALANKYGVKPIGTFAHEMTMVYAALADARGEDIRGSHNQFLEDWYEEYGEDYSIALTDTFKTDFFFSDFTPQQAKDWKGTRQDSGDPVAYGEKLIEFYESHGVDSLDKTVVFSDGLDINQIVALQEHFGGRINVVFGWGTTLTNDLGLKTLNVVMKATMALDNLLNVWAEAVKMSDDSGKITGPQEKVKMYADGPFKIDRDEINETT